MSCRRTSHGNQAEVIHTYNELLLGRNYHLLGVMSISLYCCSSESPQESRLARTPALPLTRQPTMTAAGRFAGKWSGCPTCGLSPYCPALRSKALSGRRGGGLAGLNRPAGPAHHPRRAGALCGRLARCRRRPHQHFHPAATCMAGHDRQEWSEHLALMPSCPALSTQGRAVPAQHPPTRAPHLAPPRQRSFASKRRA